MTFKFTSTQSLLFTSLIILFLLGVLFNIKSERKTDKEIVKVLNIPEIEKIEEEEEEEEEEFRIELDEETSDEYKSKENYEEDTDSDGSFKLDFGEEE